MTTDLEVAIAAATAGADIVRDRFGGAFLTEYKGRSDPVTEVDRAAEQAVIDVVRKHRPDDQIIAEESGGDAADGRRWIIDPLDGTVNFVHGIPHVAVSIGLYDGGVGLVGVIVDPNRDEVFAAAEGTATLNGQPISVSRVDDLGVAVVTTGFPYDKHTAPEAYVAPVAAVVGRANGVRRSGSAALDLAWVACGRFDAYFEAGVAAWDRAGGTIIVEAAGGTVTNAWGLPAAPVAGSILASNGILHQEMVDLIAPTIPRHHDD
ncbi:MAG: inositol monophosphatase [Acidimicrobiia bacterium]|nr:inositol monophosphatase [Acidimicrobiia bacterium]NNK90854.1 inositol monophosphatase [Acidimicrobiia bacterium]